MKMYLVTRRMGDISTLGEIEALNTPRLGETVFYQGNQYTVTEVMYHYGIDEHAGELQSVSLVVKDHAEEMIDFLRAQKTLERGKTDGPG